ncbi:MAG: hypothetical protein KC433_27245 [Anaerolineales bacterium]|nr:hypothetical protein [Anaerolineales bacterium]MCB8937560.1 hypothetical protein [Ardenticatenaceae bacterium]
MWKSTGYLAFLLFTALILLGCNEEQSAVPSPTVSPTATTASVAERPTATQTLTPTALPTATITPSATATPTTVPTETPSPTPTVFKYVMEGTAVPPASAPISAENVANLTQFARWGRGVMHDVVVSGNGRWLAVSTATGIYLHNAENLADNPRWIPTEAPVDQIAFSPDSSLIAGILPRIGASLWRVEDGERLQTIPTNAISLVFSPDSQFLALTTPSYQLEVQLWYVASGELVREYQSSFALAFSPNESNYTLAEQQDDLAYINTYQLPDHTLLTSAQVDFTGFDDGFTSMSISPDGQMVLLGKGSLIGRNDAGSIEVRKIETGELIYKIDPILAKSPGPYFCDSGFVGFEPPYAPVSIAITVSPNGDQFAVTYEEENVVRKTVAVYRLADGQLLHRFEDGVNSAAYSVDGRFLITGSEDGNLTVWQTDPFTPAQAIPAYDPPIFGLTISPDGQHIATESNYGVQLFKADDGNLLQEFASGRKASFSSTGELLAVGFADGHIEVHNLNEQTVVYQIDGGNSPVKQLTFSPNDQFLAAGAQDCTKAVYHAADGAYLHALEDLVEDVYPAGETRLQITSLVFSPDSSKLVADFSDSPKFGVWEVGNGRLINTFPESDIAGVFNLVPVPNSNQFAGLGGTYSTTDFSFWDWSSLEMNSELSRPDGNSDYVDVAFTPDGTLLAAPTDQGTIDFWQITSQEMLQSIPVDTFVYRVDFFYTPSITVSPDGTSVIVGTTDGLIYIWRVP